MLHISILGCFLQPVAVPFLIVFGHQIASASIRNVFDNNSDHLQVLTDLLTEKRDHVLCILVSITLNYNNYIFCLPDYITSTLMNERFVAAFTVDDSYMTLMDKVASSVNKKMSSVSDAAVSQEEILS